MQSRLGFRSALIACAQIATATLQIIPGATWTTSNGLHMQAHGGGLIKVDDTFYLVGEDHTNGAAFQNINCYSSKDMVQWEYLGAPLSLTNTTSDLGPGRVVERPKVLWNERTGKYVMWMHIDASSYGEAKVGVAIGDTVCGKYEYLTSFQPLGFQSRDMSLFQDDDGTAYLLSEDRANGLRVDRLSDDYLTVVNETYLWPDHIEAPCMVKMSGRYYMFGSHLTGWAPNDNVYTTSLSITGPWSPWTTFAQSGTLTYQSQINYVLKLSDYEAFYLGDRWAPSNLGSSSYVWLPLNISKVSVNMAFFPSWVPNISDAIAQSSWTLSPPNNYYEGEMGTYANGARTVSCSGCSGAESAGWLGGPSNGTVTFDQIWSSGDTTMTITIQYRNGDSTPRFGEVVVNGDTPLQIEYLPSGSSVSNSTLHTLLQKGNNTLTFGGAGNATYAADVDRLIVPVS
ncbi:carbohydrate-binding module family 35 protein [Trichoderma asperellum CBS 433.97]|uniref:Carbohydrate-binding module family 35 protein n=1 Tax=Trichoderma asperellum (strain ATCC 204424 / CBS 433.97 / NBRC 101777) TaxID=1042311 RepID=A0A2T3ZAS6_TRIA4|nr:carbohydrate-binding module family 35 protein [Trichoderma asperellum CBS 433.97]PTB41905.1 carbohydrate-binding module family 35 protein [Trichoderma asperellum CBS 433.97]